MSTMTTRRAKGSNAAVAKVLQKKQLQEMDENAPILSNLSETAAAGKKKEKKAPVKEKKAAIPMKEVELHDGNLDFDENISPKTRALRKKGTVSASASASAPAVATALSPKAQKKAKASGKKATIPATQAPKEEEDEEEDLDLISPMSLASTASVSSSASVSAKATKTSKAKATKASKAKKNKTAAAEAAPSTPQKQRTQPQDPTFSASKSLARLNLFAATEAAASAFASAVECDALPTVTTPSGGSSKYQPFKSAATPTSLFSINPAVRKAYKLIQKATGALGGNGTTGAIYGELTMHSMQKVINFLIENCSLSSASRFIDVGAGLGKPNIHAAQDPCCRVSVGIELEDIRWQLSMQNMKYLVDEMAEDAHLSVHADSDREGDAEREVKLVTGVNFLKGDIFDVATLDPFTHIYMYDLGFPPPLQQKIAEHFNESTHARYLVSYRPPRRVIGEYGYAVKEIGKINTSMTGSGENHTAYFYQRTNAPAPCRARPNTTLLRIPPRPSASGEAGEEEGELVVCSNKFLSCVKLAVGPLESLQAYVNDVTSSHLQSGRPKRDRKPRAFLDFR